MENAIEWEIDRLQADYAGTGMRQTPRVACGARALTGMCTLPYGHNIGRADVPSNHHNGRDPRSRKETDMPNLPSAEAISRQLRDIEASRAALDAREAKLQGDLAARVSLPTEPERGTVIEFNVQHAENGIIYKYVAFRSNRDGASWHTTSKSRPGPYTWDAMLDLMSSDVAVKTGARTLEFFQYKRKGEWVR